MQFLKKIVFYGLIAGILWGWASMVLNSITGIFRPEMGFIHDIISFSVGGAVFGVVVSGFLYGVWNFIPFKKAHTKAIFVSMVLWLALRVGGAGLSMMAPERYHVLTPETLQGLILSGMLGAFLGLLWARETKEA